MKKPLKKKDSGMSPSDLKKHQREHKAMMAAGLMTPERTSARKPKRKASRGRKRVAYR